MPENAPNNPGEVKIDPQIEARAIAFQKEIKELSERSQCALMPALHHNDRGEIVLVLNVVCAPEAPKTDTATVNLAE